MQNTIHTVYFTDFLQKLKIHLAGALNKQAQEFMMPKGRITTPDFSNPPQKSAVLILFYPDNGKIMFPLIRRPKYNGVHSGQMALPGGKREKDDTDLIHTALRETCEEIGICKTKVQVLGVLSDHYIPITNMMVQPVVGFVHEKPDFMIDENEVDELFTIGLDEFLNKEIKMQEMWNLRGHEVEVPFYLMQKQKVWGATAMILSELESLIVGFYQT